MFDPTATVTCGQVERVARRWAYVKWAAAAVLMAAVLLDWAWLSVPTFAAVLIATSERAERVGWLAARHIPEHQQEGT